MSDATNETHIHIHTHDHGPRFVEIPGSGVSPKLGDQVHRYVDPKRISMISQIAGGGSFVYVGKRAFECKLDAEEVVALIERAQAVQG